MKSRRLLLLAGIVFPSSVVLVALLSGPTSVPSDPEGLLAPPPIWNLCRRGFHLFVTMAPLVVLTPALLLPERHFPTLRHGFNLASVHALESAGAAFIKWGQWASTRPDLLPTSLCDQLSTLQSGAPRHSYAVTHAEVSRALKAPLSTYFDRFDVDPFASGSIGQVHLAQLQSELVAVKVRHPEVELELQTDFYIMSWAAALVQRLPGLEWFDAQSTVQQFGLTLMAQVALDDEAQHLRQMGHNFRRWRDVKLPRVLFASETVLIETYAPGVPVSQYTTAAGRELLTAAQRHLIVIRGVEIYLKMLLHDNLMHADMHPGNILFDKARSTITLVDTGLVAVLTAGERRNFIGFLQALGDGDGRRAAQCVLGWSVQQVCEDEEGFRRDMGTMFRETCNGYGTGAHIPRSGVFCLGWSTSRSPRTAEPTSHHRH